MKMYIVLDDGLELDISNYVFKDKKDIITYLENYQTEYNVQMQYIHLDDNYIDFSVWSHSQEKWLNYNLEIQEYEFFDNTSHNAKYVSIYQTTRCFGGYEEGGWYYDWHEWLETHYVENLSVKNLHELEDNLMIKYDDLKEGDVSSVLGGVTLTIFEEDYPMQYQTKFKPKYE